MCVRVLTQRLYAVSPQIQRYQGKLTRAELDALQQKGRDIERKVEATKSSLSHGGVTAYKSKHRHRVPCSSVCGISRRVILM